MKSYLVSWLGLPFIASLAGSWLFLICSVCVNASSSVNFKELLLQGDPRAWNELFSKVGRAQELKEDDIALPAAEAIFSQGSVWSGEG